MTRRRDPPSRGPSVDASRTSRGEPSEESSNEGSEVTSKDELSDGTSNAASGQALLVGGRTESAGVSGAERSREVAGVAKDVVEDDMAEEVVGNVTEDVAKLVDEDVETGERTFRLPPVSQTLG